MNEKRREGWKKRKDHLFLSVLPSILFFVSFFFPPFIFLSGGIMLNSYNLATLAQG